MGGMALAALPCRRYRFRNVTQPEAGSMAPNDPKPTAPKPARAAKADKPAKPEKPARSPKAKPEAAAAAVAAPSAKPEKAERKKAAAAVETIKLRNLVDTVAAATGAKKPDAKKSVEAVLEALGAGLAARSVFVVPPLGKLRVAKSNGLVLTLKLRLADSARAAGLALADDDEDS
jgi:hypothetical protein